MKGSLSEILILTVLMMSFVIGFAGFYGAMASNPDYGLTSNVSTLESQQKIKDLANTINQSSMAFQKISSTNNTAPQNILYMVVYAPYQFIVASIEVGKLVFQVPGLMFSMESDIITSIPGLGGVQWVVNVVNLIIMIVVLFAIIYFIVGKK